MIFTTIHRFLHSCCSKGDVFTSEKEDDEGGFRSLPSTRSLNKTSAVASGVFSAPCSRRSDTEKEVESTHATGASGGGGSGGGGGGGGMSRGSSRGSTSATPSPLMPAMMKGAVTRNNSLVKALAAGRAERVEAVSAASPTCPQHGTEVAIRTSPRDGSSASAKVKRIYI